MRQSPRPTGNQATIACDGPLCVSGKVRIEFATGKVVTRSDVALCRCGASRKQPFCDDSHQVARFKDAGVIQGGRMVGTFANSTEERTVTIVCAQDGPLLVQGDLTVTGEDGVSSRGTKGALCRCGESATKPFCDGAHKRIGFIAK